MLEPFKAARRAGVPLITIRTPDAASAVREITSFYRLTRDEKRKKLEKEGKEKEASEVLDVTILQWDVARGLIAVDEKSAKAAELINRNEQKLPPPLVTGNPVQALARATEGMPPDSILFMMNMHILIEDKDRDRLAILQAIWNMRDPFKANTRTLVLLVPDMKIPPELANDMITLDVELPGDDELTDVILKQFAAAGLPKPGSETMKRAVDTVSGLSRFTAEQVIAMSLTSDGLNMRDMWERKRTIIEQVGGLKVATDDRVTFDDIGGLDNIKSFLRQVIKGKRKPRLVVLWDELEKYMGGGEGDSGGTDGDALGQVLSNMQDNDWGGVLFPGVPGTGKTELAKAMGFEADGLFIKFDFGGMKDKWVGNSQKMVRNAMKILKAMGGRDVFFIGTTNSMDALRPELKSRFTYGTYFFDLPNKTERAPIWNIWLKKYSIQKQEMPDDEGWTGREIRAACKIADELQISLKDAALRISPTGRGMGKKLDALRLSAHGKYLSASKPGFYESPTRVKATAPKDTPRKIDMN